MSARASTIVMGLMSERSRLTGCCSHLLAAVSTDLVVRATAYSLNVDCLHRFSNFFCSVSL